MTSPGERWVRITDGVAAREVEDEVVVLDVTTRRYHALNPTAGLVWSLLETGATRAELVAALSEAYDVEPVTAEADLAAFLDALERAGLAERRPA